ncbi:hypothetical protein C8Q80DRAFT_1267072 [Daedaleopsis nitida]|nr:hypothetical protein C8Q80DRAFT_1267072 [Daedaleopsis nitida]
MTSYSISDTRLDELSSALGNVAGGLQDLEREWVSQKLRAQMYEIVLSSVFSGLHTILVLVAVYLLCRKGLGNVPMFIMLVIILSLYTSTTVYWATVLAEAFREVRFIMTGIASEASRLNTITSNFRQAVVESGTGSIDSSLSSAVQEQLTSWWPRPTQECVGTASLTVNVVLGDAVVWWRALVLWQRCPARRCVYSIFLVCITLIPGVVVTTQACNSGSSPILLSSGGSSATVSSGSFYIRDEWGLAASVLSLLANFLSTSLIAYKAWEHRRLVRLGLGRGSARTRVEKALALLIESGTIYCVLWILIVAYQAGSITMSPTAYIYRFHFIVEGCLIALIAIYPTLIVILVAMNQSQCEATLSGQSCYNLRFSMGGTSQSGVTGTSLTQATETETETATNLSQCDHFRPKPPRAAKQRGSGSNTYCPFAYAARTFKGLAAVAEDPELKRKSSTSKTPLDVQKLEGGVS